MENILKVFLMAFPEWLACIFMVVGLVVTAAGGGTSGITALWIAKTVYKWIVKRRKKSSARLQAQRRKRTLRGAARLHPGLAGLGNQ